MKWPEDIPVGPLLVKLMAVEDGDMAEITPDEPQYFEGAVPGAMYDSNMLMIAYMPRMKEDEPRLMYRVDNDICHEIVHAWEDIIMAYGLKLSESEVQALGNAVHQLLLSVLEANGVEDDGLEISRAESSS